MKETLLVKEQNTTFEITASNSYKYETLNRRERRNTTKKE